MDRWLCCIFEGSKIKKQKQIMWGENEGGKMFDSGPMACKSTPSRMAFSPEVAVSETKERTTVESITAIPRDWHRTSPGQLLLAQPVCPLWP